MTDKLHQTIQLTDGRKLGYAELVHSGANYLTAKP